MAKRNDGGPAFPQNRVMGSSGEVYQWEAPGMALRDWLAGQALAGALASLVRYDARVAMERRAAATGLSVPALAAREAYEQADAMLAEREREGG